MRDMLRFDAGEDDDESLGDLYQWMDGVKM
jgi:hypothetical protein